MDIELINLDKFIEFGRQINQILAERHLWIMETYPVGSTIQFDHNGHTQDGTVLEHDAFPTMYPRILVENMRTGTTRYVSIFSVIAAYEEEE